MSDIREILTLLLAVWGSLTGTAALALRFVSYRKDQVKLDVQAAIEYRTYEIPPPSPSAKVSAKVANVGYRAASISAVLVKRSVDGEVVQLRKDPREYPVPLASGSFENLSVSSSQLPRGMKFSDISSLIVEDHTGRRWESVGVAGLEKFRSLSESQEYKKEYVNKTENYRSVSIDGYRSGNECRVLLRINTGSRPNTHRYVDCRDLTEADELTATLKQKAVDYVDSGDKSLEGELTSVGEYAR